MSDNAALIREKLDQAVRILNEQNVDAWMTFVRETSLAPDPCLDLILGLEMVWQSAFIVTHDNQRIAVVGLHDAEDIHGLGCYTQVVTYIHGIRDELVRVLTDLNPKQLALNYSVNDVAADGLGHGLMMLLWDHLHGTGLPDRFVSAEGIVGALRGRKSPAEVERIKAAIATTQELLGEVGRIAKPGMSEKAIADHILALADSRGLGTAWDRGHCPAVSAGPDSPVGHAGPQEHYTVQPGTLLHVDFGVRQADYCADLQRIWYVRRDDYDTPPEPLQRAFEVVRQAIKAGFEALKPGVAGWQVDEVARRTIVDAGYPEYQHAFGHHVGRQAHDGATVLGPRWERYGQTPYGLVEAGNVFAIELGVFVDGIGYVGQEENVLVTEHGAVWLSEPQDDIWLI